jgi:hypothetical protein
MRRRSSDYYKYGRGHRSPAAALGTPAPGLRSALFSCFDLCRACRQARGVNSTSKADFERARRGSCSRGSAMGGLPIFAARLSDDKVALKAALAGLLSRPSFDPNTTLDPPSGTFGSCQQRTAHQKRNAAEPMPVRGGAGGRPRLTADLLHWRCTPALYIGANISEICDIVPWEFPS